jgi:hypothetical protein
MSIANLHFSESRTISKQPVPALDICPSIIFSETPLTGSTSEWTAASIRISTVSSKEHLINGPTSCRLIP